MRGYTKFRGHWLADVTRSLSHKVITAMVVATSSVNASDYGVRGIIDTPDARMDPDGFLLLSAGKDERHKQFSITYQALPWLQASFRYSGIEGLQYWDRNYEVKAQIISETSRLPALSVGVRDLVGTGLFGSEYIVATKELGPLEGSVGVGWGRLSGEGDFRNPLVKLDSRFETRTISSNTGGELTPGTYFSGKNVGVFGGLKYKLDSAPVTLLFERNPDQYNRGVYRRQPSPRSDYSFGLTWHLSDQLDISLTQQHGEELGLRFTSKFDTRAEPAFQREEPVVSSFYLPQKDFPTGFDKNNWYQRLLLDAERSGLLLIEGRISADQKQVELIVGNINYQLWADALSRHIALADLHLPATVELLNFVIEDSGHRVSKIIIPRPSSLEEGYGRPEFLQRIRVSRGVVGEPLNGRTSFVTGQVNTTINFKAQFQFFDPDDPARYQLFLGIDSEYAITDKWIARSSVALDMENNFGESRRRESDSVLPKVRTDIVKYLQDGSNRLQMLMIERRDTAGSSIHYRAFGGILEQMYSGMGLEALYWPAESRWAIGANFSAVKKRDFDGLLGHQDYSVTTGFLSAFYASPYFNYDFAIHAGRYLAKDFGSTLEVRRTFRNGWQVGLWATVTDVSSKDFGEGSFDKGIYFQVPISAVFGASPSRSKFSTGIRPIQRDGGQRLEGHSGRLFWDLRDARFDSFVFDERMLK